MSADPQILIVGGGPAGLATAIELRNRGLEVLVVDRAVPPIDKACGEGLMPDGVERLERLGVELPELESAPLTGIRYIEEDLQAEALFPRQPGRGIRRPVLHRALIDRAAEMGVRMKWGVTARSLVPPVAPSGPDRADAREGHWAVETDMGPIIAEWIVGADGLHSRIRAWLGLHSPTGRRQRFGVRRHYSLAPWTDRVEVYWSDGAEAYVTPVSTGEVGIALLWSGEKANFEGLLDRFPRLVERLGNARPSSADRGAARLEQRTRACHRGRVALVGDAAGYRDAITGEGLSLAFHQAEALAEAIENGDLEGYGRAVKRLTRLPFLLIRLLLIAERRPRLRRRMIRTLAAEPGLFARLLAVHTRDAPPSDIGITGLLLLARGLLG